MSKKKRIQWVCQSCADERGAKMPIEHIATWHIDKCDLCGRPKSVTEPRDFGRDRNKLEND